MAQSSNPFLPALLALGAGIAVADAMRRLLPAPRTAAHDALPAGPSPDPAASPAEQTSRAVVPAVPDLGLDDTELDRAAASPDMDEWMAGELDGWESMPFTCSEIGFLIGIAGAIDPSAIAVGGTDEQDAMARAARVAEVMQKARIFQQGPYTRFDIVTE